MMINAIFYALIFFIDLLREHEEMRRTHLVVLLPGTRPPDKKGRQIIMLKPSLPRCLVQG
jgi:hypothetical protein